MARAWRGFDKGGVLPPELCKIGLEQSDMPVLTLGLPRASQSIVDLIGHTPLVRLSGFEKGLRNVELWAKAEWRNPGGSVKDRPAARMILEGEESGALTRDKILLDATSGNTGIAYAMIGAARGYRVRLCVPDNVTPERKRILRAFGAEVVFTDPMEGSDGAIVRAKAMYEAEPEVYFYADQYNNAGNWRSHYDTTGPEIIEQADGRVTHFVAGLGTSGTFVGVGRRLREFKPQVRLISVQPDSPLHGLEGLKHMGTAIVPGIYDSALADEDVGVGTEEAFELTRDSPARDYSSAYRAARISRARCAWPGMRPTPSSSWCFAMAVRNTCRNVSGANLQTETRSDDADAPRRGR